MSRRLSDILDLAEIELAVREGFVVRRFHPTERLVNLQRSAWPECAAGVGRCATPIPAGAARRVLASAPKGSEGYMSVCNGCGHPRARHYRDVDNIVRCMVVASGRSTSGVIGEPWSQECDCTNYRSRQAARARARERKDLAERRRATREWVKELKKALREDTTK